MSVLPLALGVLVAAARAQTAPEPAPPPGEPPPAPPSPEQRLADALRVYTEGDVATARQELQALLAMGPSLPAAVRRDTLAYLGDIWYSEQGPSAAEPFFRALLDEAPDYVMDPVEHPAEVARYVDSLRPPPRPLDVVVIPPLVVKPRPFPWLALVPGGVSYFADGRVGAGLAVAGTQSALLVVNLVLFQEIQAIDGVVRGSDDVEAWSRLELATDLTAAAFYISVVVPPLVEVSQWSSAAGAAPRTRVGLTPTGVAVHGTF